MQLLCKSKVVFKRSLLTSALSLCIAGVAHAGAVSTLSKAVQTKENMEAAVPLPAESKIAQDKLAALYKKTGKRPNIVLLLADDLGWGDPGVYGGGKAIGADTPNIDMLAQQGLRLTSAYSQPTSTPTRSALLTGRLPVRTGLTRPILAGDKLTSNPWADETSLAKILSDSGYETVLVGKWHIGEQVGMRPQDVGFDEFYGYYPAQKELSQSFDERRYPDLVLDKEKLAAYNKIDQSHALIHGFKNGKTTEVEQITNLEQMGEIDHGLKEFTLAKIKELKKDGKPFFLEHAFMKPHADNFASKEFKGKSASKYPYKDAVVEVDAYVGEIVAALKEAGELDNTLIIFTSDNGPQLDSWPDTGFTPFKGGKGTGWDGAVRMPFVAYWPGMIKPGQVSEGLFDLMDIFNTSIALAGAEDKIPTDRYIDGINQVPFLLGDDGKSARDKVFIWSESNFLAIRMDEYKMHFKIFKYNGPWLAIDEATIQNVGLSPWLYNLYIDPKEQYPVGHRMNAWVASLGAEAKAMAATFKKYPPKKVGLGGVQ